MSQGLAQGTRAYDRLAGILEGMPVYDLHDRKVGTVKHVQFADDSVDEAMIVDDPSVHSAPPPVRMRLLKSGYIRIGTGFLSRDCYVTPDQIEYLGSDGVQLNVLRNQLMRF
jgi:hypothetical protein